MPLHERDILEYGRERKKSFLPLATKLVAIVAVSAACLYSLKLGCSRVMEPQVGTARTPAESPVRNLPSEATNIAYSLPGAFGPATYFEFDIPESAFLRWVGESGWQASPIGSDGCEIWRHNPATGYGIRFTVNQGHFYRWQHEDSSRTVVFDAETGRAYYAYHSR